MTSKRNMYVNVNVNLNVKLNICLTLVMKVTYASNIMVKCYMPDCCIQQKGHENIINLLSAEFAQSMAKVKMSQYLG